jgi:glycyl-tRNA synthetase beta chain
MSDAKPLLIEIGCEELPPKALDELAGAFAKGIADGLGKAGFVVETENIKTYNSPRRLTVMVRNVPMAQPDQALERRGPALNAAVDGNGQPTRALLGFAASCGVSVEQLEKLETDKGAWFVYRAQQQGRAISALVPEIVANALKTLPIPKPMRWGNHDYAFVRPVHWLVILHGDHVIDTEIFGIRSGRLSRGHRFHHPQSVHLANADSYVEALRAARVLADPATRRARVRDEVERMARDVGGLPRLRDPLLDEIANITEWPVAVACVFDREFLGVPQEALIQTMETNQKFVPVFDTGGNLTEHFIGVANIESTNPGEIRKGYERVIRPRFADAKFFYDEDLKTPLATNQEALKAVTYQQQLGSVWDKCMRVAELARVIANRVGVDAALATRAAALCKCDLLTRMVGEFPELQGVMGRYYASHGEHSEPVEVAQALDEFYRPRFAGDAIASGKVGQVLSVAERIDTLAGIFAVGMKPSGNKDPFALRRAALGLARTLIEGKLELDLRAQFSEALALLPDAAFAAGLPKSKDGKTAALDLGKRRDELNAELYTYILERLRAYYAEQGIAGDAFESVRALAPASLLDFDQRLRAVVEFAALPQAQALAAANKRIGNILHQAGGNVSGTIDSATIDAGAETELQLAVETTAASIAPLIKQGRYVEILRELAALREPVDRFFNDVMVMADNDAKRRNRLILLSRLQRMFLEVADISVLQA